MALARGSHACAGHRRPRGALLARGSLLAVVLSCLHLFGTDFIAGFPLQQAARQGLHQVRALETSESSSQTSEAAEVFATGFDKDMTEEAIREYFAKAGPIVKYEGMCKGRQARLTYSSAADAKNAVASLNGITIEGNIHPLVVQISRRAKELPTETTVFVAGYDRGTSTAVIKEHCGKAGSIVEFKKIRDFLLLTYSSSEEAATAVASLNGTIIQGNSRFIIVEHSKGSPKVAGEAGVVEDIKKEKKKPKKPKVADGVEKTQKIKKELPTETTVFVVGYDRGTDTTVIKEHCGKAGSIVDSMKIRNFLLLTYSSSEEAATAVSSLNGTTIQGNSRFLTVEHFKGAR